MKEAKPITNNHTLYDLIYMKYPKQANSQRQKIDKWLPGAGGRRDWGRLFHGCGTSVWEETVLELYGGKKAMSTHSSTLACKIPWLEEPGGLHSMGSLSHTRLSNFNFTFHFHVLEKEMATHSSVLAWRIPGMGEPGGLPSMGSHSVGHD